MADATEGRASQGVACTAPLLHSRSVVLLWLIALLACERESADHAAKQGGNRVADAEASVRDAAPSIEAGLPQIVKRDGTISVQPEPPCAEGWSPSAGTGGAAAQTNDPVSAAEVRAHGEALERELENWKPFIAGTGRDERLGAMVLLLHRDFGDYDGLRKKLESVSGAIEIVLQPACYSRREIDEARRAIEARDWHPRAKSVPMAWYFDVRFSGFSVSIDQSAPEVAKALEQRLGKLVRTHLGNLGPHPDQSRDGRPRRLPKHAPLSP